MSGARPRCSAKLRSSAMSGTMSMLGMSSFAAVFAAVACALRAAGAACVARCRAHRVDAPDRAFGANCLQPLSRMNGISRALADSNIRAPSSLQTWVTNANSLLGDPMAGPFGILMMGQRRQCDLLELVVEDFVQFVERERKRRGPARRRLRSARRAARPADGRVAKPAHASVTFGSRRRVRF
jgi:hypothetical protein